MRVSEEQVYEWHPTVESRDHSVDLLTLQVQTREGNIPLGVSRPNLADWVAQPHFTFLKRYNT